MLSASGCWRRWRWWREVREQCRCFPGSRRWWRWLRCLDLSSNCFRNIFRTRVDIALLSRKHPSHHVIFSGQNMAQQGQYLSHCMTSLSLQNKQFWHHVMWKISGENLRLEVAEGFHIRWRGGGVDIAVRSWKRWLSDTNEMCNPQPFLLSKAVFFLGFSPTNLPFPSLILQISLRFLTSWHPKIAHPRGYRQKLILPELVFRPVLRPEWQLVTHFLCLKKMTPSKTLFYSVLWNAHMTIFLKKVFF